MNDKQLVAIEAAKFVKDGMVVGLGTGSTADFFIAELARRFHEEGLKVSAVSSSIVSMRKAQLLDLPLLAIEQLGKLDLYVDGADEVTPDNTLLKGQGADLVREKLLARASEQFIVLVDQSKMVDQIGDKFAIPVEVMPFAWQLVKQSLAAFGGKSQLRESGNGLAVSSHGSLILDVTFNSGLDSQALDECLNATPGVVEHGVFKDLASVVLLAEDGQVRSIES